MTKKTRTEGGTASPFRSVRWVAALWATLLAGTALAPAGEPWLSVVFYATCAAVLLSPPPDLPKIGAGKAWAPAVSRVLLAAGAVGIAARLAFPTGFGVWPFPDESAVAQISATLSREWDWKPFRFFTDLPAFYFWAEALFFKIAPPGWTSIGLFPGLVGAASLAAAGWALRGLNAGRLPAWVFAAFAVGFWPVYLSRFNIPQVMLHAWFWLSVGSAWRHLDGKEGKDGWYQWAVFFSVGGLYTAFQGSLLLAWALILPFFGSRPPGERWKLFSRGLGLAVLLSAPLGISAFRNGFGSYLAALWAGHAPMSPMEHLSNTLAYWRSIFTGIGEGGPEAYGFRPLWGGSLNPLSGALTVLGIWMGRKLLPGPMFRWWLWGGLVFFTPALLTRDYEFCRLAPLAAWVCLPVASGAEAWMRETRGRVGLLLVLAALSLGWDARHLGVVYPRTWTRDTHLWLRSSKSIVQYRAYRMLRELAHQKGPGWVMNHLVADPYDQSLGMAVRSFNSAAPEGAGVEPRWAAWVADRNTEPFLRKDFPGVRIARLSGPSEEVADRWSLFMVDVDDGNRGRLSRWADANRVCERATVELMEGYQPPKTAGVIHQWTGRQQLFRGDPFLAMVYGERLARLAYLNRDYDLNVEALHTALEGGYPSAHLYFNLASLKARKGAWDEALRYLDKADQCPVNDTETAYLRAWIKNRRSGGGSP